MTRRAVGNTCWALLILVLMGGALSLFAEARLTRLASGAPCPECGRAVRE